MTQDLLLEELVNLMSNIKEGTVRSVRTFYYVDPELFPKTKLVGPVLILFNPTIKNNYFTCC